MKTIAIYMAAIVAALVLPNRTMAQAQEIAQLQLNIQKLKQLKSILSQIKDGYQIVTQGYGKIKNIAKGDYDLHKGHLDGLLNVSPTVRHYSRVAQIIENQYRLVSEYRNAYARFAASKSFRPEELSYIDKVYGRLLSQSLDNLKELTTVLSSGKTRMTDDERLQAIDRIHSEMEEKLSFLREFNNSASVLALQRQREKKDVKSVETLYGIKF